MGGEDTDLGAARKKMVTDLSRLQNATEFAILGNTEELKRMNDELNTNQALHTEMLEEQKHAIVSIQTDTESIRSDMTKLLVAFQSQAKREGKAPVPDANKPASATRIRNAMLTVPGDTQQYRILKETMIKDTCGWLFTNAQWDSWVKEDTNSVLAVVGQPGVGKSHLAAAVYDHLVGIAKANTSKQSCVTHFYFREQHADLRIFLAAIITVINQVAEQNESLCEMINAEMIKDETSYSVTDWKGLMTSLLAPAFHKTSKNHLFVVLDGLDELYDLNSVSECVNLIHDQELRISIVFTTRPEVLDKTTFNRELRKVEVTKDDQLQDFKALAWHRINSLGHTRRFRRYVQQRIAETVEQISPSKSILCLVLLTYRFAIR